MARITLVANPSFFILVNAAVVDDCLTISVLAPCSLKQLVLADWTLFDLQVAQKCNQLKIRTWTKCETARLQLHSTRGDPLLGD